MRTAALLVVAVVLTIAIDRQLVASARAVPAPAEASQSVIDACAIASCDGFGVNRCVLLAVEATPSAIGSCRFRPCAERPACVRGE